MNKETKICRTCKRELLLINNFYARDNGNFYNVCKKCKLDGAKKLRRFRKLEQDILSLIERYPGLCIECKKNTADIDHHISYRFNVIAPLCKKCDCVVHRNKSHPYHPVDSKSDSPNRKVLVAFRMPPRALKKVDKIQPATNSRSEKLRRIIEDYPLQKEDREIKNYLKLIAGCVEKSPDGKNYLRMKTVLRYDG